jgi:hypothetical protein
MHPLQKSDVLEVTITHNLGNEAEVSELFDRQFIALNWGRRGPNPAAYTHRRAKMDVKLFHEMRRNGAAVIAAYKGATAKQSDRLVGWVAPRSNWRRVNGLLCLPLSKARVVDSSRSFLGNLAPRLCTVQTCHNRAMGRLADFVLRRKAIRSVLSLHHHDVEWLVTNFLFSQRLCGSVWSGSRSTRALTTRDMGRRAEKCWPKLPFRGNLLARRLLDCSNSRREIETC